MALLTDQNLEAKAHCLLPTRLSTAPALIPILCQWARGANTRLHFIATGARQALKYADLLGEWWVTPFSETSMGLTLNAILQDE